MSGPRQREVPVTNLKAKQWVYLPDETVWLELARDPGQPHGVPVGGPRGGWLNVVNLNFPDRLFGKDFPAGAKLWMRLTEEGD